MSIFDEVKPLTLRYIRHGGKKNRRRQAEKMRAFVKFCAGMGCRGLGNIGRRHVQAFFAAHTKWTPSTRYAYRLAVENLFELAGLPPPHGLSEIEYPRKNSSPPDPLTPPYQS